MSAAKKRRTFSGVVRRAQKVVSPETIAMATCLRQRGFSEADSSPEGRFLAKLPRSKSSLRAVLVADFVAILKATTPQLKKAQADLVSCVVDDKDMGQPEVLESLRQAVTTLGGAYAALEAGALEHKV